MNFNWVKNNIEKIKENKEKEQTLKLIRERDFRDLRKFFEKHNNLSRKNVDRLFKAVCKYDFSCYIKDFFEGYDNFDYTVEKIPVVYQKLSSDGSTAYAQEELDRIFDLWFAHNIDKKKLYEELIKYGIKEHLNYLISHMISWRCDKVNDESLVLLIENSNMADELDEFYSLKEQVDERFSKNEDLKKKCINKINKNLIAFVDKKIRKAENEKEIIKLLFNIYWWNEKIDFEAGEILTKKFLQLFVGRINSRGIVNMSMERDEINYLYVLIEKFLPEDKQAFDSWFKIGINSVTFCEGFYNEIRENYNNLSEKNKALFKDYVLKKGDNNTILEFTTEHGDDNLIKKLFDNEMNLILYCYKNGKMDIATNYMDNFLDKNESLIDDISKRLENKSKGNN